MKKRYFWQATLKKGQRTPFLATNHGSFGPERHQSGYPTDLMVMEHEKYEKHESNQEHHDIIMTLSIIFFWFTISTCLQLQYTFAVC